MQGFGGAPREEELLISRAGAGVDWASVPTQHHRSRRGPAAALLLFRLTIGAGGISHVPDPDGGVVEAASNNRAVPGELD